MGICSSKPDALSVFVNKNILPYPGSKVYISTLLLHWVWEKDCKYLIEYISEYDPLSLKTINGNTTKTLDCIARYRRTKGLPFLQKGEETYRYNCLIRARDGGTIGGYTIVNIPSKYGVIEYLDNCKYMG